MNADQKRLPKLPELPKSPKLKTLPQLFPEQLFSAAAPVPPRFRGFGFS